MRIKQPRIVEVLLKLKTSIPFMVGHIGGLKICYYSHMTQMSRQWTVRDVRCKTKIKAL